MLLLVAPLRHPQQPPSDHCCDRYFALMGLSVKYVNSLLHEWTFQPVHARAQCNIRRSLEYLWGRLDLPYSLIYSSHPVLMGFTHPERMELPTCL